VDPAKGDYRLRQGHAGPIRDRFDPIDLGRIGIEGDFPYELEGDPLTRLYLETEKTNTGQATVAMTVGQKQPLHVFGRTKLGFYVSPEEADSIDYRNFNPNAATINDAGLIRAKAPGRSQIIVTMQKGDQTVKEIIWVRVTKG
jgi:hypothetical protein